MSKNVIITGGSSGIGLGASQKYYSEGYRVHILDLSEPDDLSVENIYFHFCDVSDALQVEEVITKIATQDYPDILINNAGIASIGSLETTTEDEFDRIFKVNVKGVFNCSKSVLRFMKSKGGVIINMASIASHVGLSDRFAYSMSKGAVYAMTNSIAKDYLVHGIRCVSLSPGRVHTPFVDAFVAKNYPNNQEEMFEKLSKSQPIGRMGKPEEIAELMFFLSSDKASFITGTDFPIDGGFIKLNT